MQQVVGGYIEMLQITENGLCLICNEEGKEDSSPLPLLLSCFCSVGITWGAIPMLVNSYRSALAGFSVGPATARALPFWPLFLLGLALAFILYYVFQWLGTTLNPVPGIVAVLMGVLAITAVVSRKAGESRTEFLVGRDKHEGKNVAVLFSDEYGGLVTRK